jgi:hypothetical protein
MSFVDVSDGMIQIEGDKTGPMQAYVDKGWLGNSVDGTLGIDFDVTRTGWTTVQAGVVSGPVCSNNIAYWTGWANDDWADGGNWVCDDGSPAGGAPGADYQANLWELNDTSTFSGDARIASGTTVEINRLEWRVGKFVGPDPVSITVEGALIMPSAAFGNFSIASTMTIPTGGVVDVEDTFWLAQNYNDGQQSVDATANGGANLNVDGGLFMAKILQVGWGDNHFDQNPDTPYLNVRVTGGGLMELTANGSCGLNINNCDTSPNESMSFVDVSDGMIQILDDKTGPMEAYVTKGWLGNSSGGGLAIDFDVTRTGWTTVRSLLVAPADFVRGEINGDGQYDISDPVYLLNWLFLSGPRPTCEEAADADGNRTIELTDAVVLFDNQFAGGAPPPPPFPDCGPDFGATFSCLSSACP